MPAREIKVEIVGDASSFTKASDAVSREAGQMSSTFDRLQKDANEASRGIDKTSSSLKDAGEAGGDMESAFRGVLDVTGAVGEQFGVALPAGLQTGLQGITDIGGGIESFIRGAPGFLAAAVSMTTAIWAQVTALTAQAAAFVVANAPIIALIAVIALVAAGVYLLIQHWDTITEKVPALGVAFEAVKAALQSFVDWITGVLVPAVMGIADKFIEGAQKIVSAIQTGFAPIKAILETYVNAWKLVIEAVWTQIQIYVQTAIGVIQGVIDVAMGLITGDWDRAWSGIKQIVDSIWKGIQATVENAIGLLKGLGGLMLEAGSTLMQALKSGLMDIWFQQVMPFILGLPGEMLSFLGDVSTLLLNAGKAIAKSLLDGLKAGFNAVKDEVGSWGGKIKDLKGPIEEDAVLLEPEGMAIAAGLNQGLQQGFFGVVLPGVASWGAQIRAAVDPWANGGTPAMQALEDFMGGGGVSPAFQAAYAAWRAGQGPMPQIPGGAGKINGWVLDPVTGKPVYAEGYVPGTLTPVDGFAGQGDLPGGTTWGGGNSHIGFNNTMPDWMGGTTIAPGPAWATPSVGDWSGNGTARVQWNGSQWIQGGIANQSGPSPYAQGVNYGGGYHAGNPAPTVIKLVVDGQTLAEVVNTANGKQL